jgi:5'-3' exoribonuclease 4
MFDIIYVRETHPLAAQIAFLYQMYSQQMITDPSYCISIDPAARLVYILHILIWIVYFLMVLFASIFTYYVGILAPGFSGGMNGFLCLSQRNWYSISVGSPVKGFNGITNNRVL